MATIVAPENGPAGVTAESPPASPFQREAERINAEHEACRAAVRNTFEHALRAGQLLQSVKDQLKRHGELFSPWVERHCHFGVRTAELYMQVAREVRSGSLDPKRVSGESFRGAIERVRAAYRGPTPPPPRPPPRDPCLVRFSFGFSAQAERFWALLSRCHAAGDPGPLLLDLLEAHVGRQEVR